MPEKEKKILAERQAYEAMLKFLERQYARTASDDIGVLLGSASLLEDGSPADPALADEWHECVETVLEAGKDKIAAE
ncbi:hypothetical protein ABGN05_13280 [Aquibium sp. LZ166]|uniref:Uncharacterized protein n=1 Tax=Aquibium pacificus TaxID=3153579 RepID=A0ABV3SKX3_9HYPH